MKAANGATMLTAVVEAETGLRFEAFPVTMHIDIANVQFPDMRGCRRSADLLHPFIKIC